MTAALPAEVRERVLQAMAAPRLGTPEDIAAAVAYVSSDDAGYLTGQVICVDGGLTNVLRRPGARRGPGLFGTWAEQRRPGYISQIGPARAAARAGPRYGDAVVTEQEIEQQVIEIVADQMSVEKDKITRETSFVNDLNADSLDTVELVMEFEDRFETTIPDERAEQIKTVGEAIQFILEAKNLAQSSS